MAPAGSSVIVVGLRWGLAIAVGILGGWIASKVVPPEHDANGAIVVSAALVIPFVLLLALIAAMPLAAPRFWHDRFPEISFMLGSSVAAYYLAGHGAAGRAALAHAAIEYWSFIALVGGLYVASGAILTEIRGRARPWSNTALLIFGSAFANLVGTTGASMLLIRPFMRFNEGRLRAIHVVFFIFMVSNCGGCLTPIGDPPLYLGYLKGVPFDWTMRHLSKDWALVIGLLAAIFFIVDSVIEKALPPRDPSPRITGSPVRLRGAFGMFGLAAIVLFVFVDPWLMKAGYDLHFPVGATAQILMAAAVYFFGDRAIYRANEFSFFPVKEVGILFLGIFTTMVPALAFLAAHGPELDVKTPTAFYFLTGGLSAVLDNAPTYMNFLQLSVGDLELSAQTIRERLLDGEGRSILIAISSGAVYFGAMTYIGNGPNFMVRSIAEAAGKKMPSFFGYLGLALMILFPVLVVHWWFMIR